MPVRKILFVTNIPNHYRIPLFNTLHLKFEEKGVQMKVIFAAAGYDHRKAKIQLDDCLFDYVVLSSSSVRGKQSEQTMFNYEGLRALIKADQPDHVIVSGFSMGTLKVWAGSILGGPSYSIWTGSTRTPGGMYSFLRNMQRKIVLNRARSFIAYGSKSKAYLQGMGAHENQIHVALNTVDTRFFKDSVNALRETNSTNSSSQRLTYIGYLTKRKNVQVLLKAIAKLSAKRSDFVLDIVGDGDQRNALEQYVKNLQLSDAVCFHGFQQNEELPKFLVSSSCFLFQTDFDIWGLVLNEAMASGVPCISSINAGASCDLIKEGETGFQLDFADTDALVAKIEFVLDHPKEMEEMGKHAQQFIEEKVNLEHAAANIIKAIP